MCLKLANDTACSSYDGHLVTQLHLWTVLPMLQYAVAKYMATLEGFIETSKGITHTHTHTHTHTGAPGCHTIH